MGACLSQASVKTPTEATLEVGNAKGSNAKIIPDIVKKCSFAGKKAKGKYEANIWEWEKYMASLLLFGN